MTVAEIMQKIGELSPEDQTLLRRELEEMLPKPEMEDVTPETAKALQTERRSGDECGVPIEDTRGQDEAAS
jgi:hypothetical protein